MLGLVGELFPERFRGQRYSVTLESGRCAEHSVGSVQIIQNSQKAIALVKLEMVEIVSFWRWEKW